MSKYKIISWVMVIIWMALIFSLSSQVREQSNELSTGITEVIVKTVDKVVPNADFDIEKVNHILRKNAHFFAYLVLGMLVLNALKNSAQGGLKFYALALGICVLYAISDEVHQMFVPGRGPQVRDVFIDSAGAIVGMSIFAGLLKLKEKWKFN